MSVAENIVTDSPDRFVSSTSESSPVTFSDNNIASVESKEINLEYSQSSSANEISESSSSLQEALNLNLQKLEISSSGIHHNDNTSDESEDENNGKVGLNYEEFDENFQLKSGTVNHDLKMLNMLDEDKTAAKESLPENNVLSLNDAFNFEKETQSKNMKTNSVTTSDGYNKSSRINPFNSPDDEENLSERMPTLLPSSYVPSPVKSNHSQLTYSSDSDSASISQHELHNGNTQFALMPSKTRTQTNFTETIADIQKAIKEVKKKTMSPSNSQNLDLTNGASGPWVKMGESSPSSSQSRTPTSPISRGEKIPEFEKMHPKTQHNQNGINLDYPSSSAYENPRHKETRTPKSSLAAMEKDVTSETNHKKPYSDSPDRFSNDGSVLYVPGPCEPDDLIEGIIFTANYLGSTQLMSEKNPAKNSRMYQAQEAVSRIKAPEGEHQPSVEVDLFISTSKVKVLNADTQETMMEHFLRSISYIADIGDLLVIMAKRRPPRGEQEEDDMIRVPKQEKRNRIICHVFSSPDAHLMAQAIGQAFNVAYQQFLRANGIEPQTLTQEDFNTILDTQEMYHDDLVHYSKQENIKELWIEKKKGEGMGIVVVESGWGSILPTVVLANMQHGSPVERSGKLSIGDQIMAINSTSLVGLPLMTCHSIIKGLKNHTLVKMNIVSCPPVVTVLIKRPDLKYQLGFSVQNGIICSLMRGGIAERGGVRVGHRIIEINSQSVVATQHDKIVQMLVTSVGEIQMKTMPAAMYRLLTGQEQPVYM